MAVVTPGLARTVPSIVDLIGNTPLIRLRGFEAGLRNVELWAKAEWRNPGGSVKDRGAARMVLEGEKSGALTRDKILLDATSGNTGIAYAMLGAATGFRVRLCVPGNVTPERKRILKAFGAEVIFTDPMQGSDGAILRTKAMYAENPDIYFYPDQYNNPANWRAHYDTTAPELLEQTNGRITHFVCGLGTSGTFIGTGRRLRESEARRQAGLGAARFAAPRPRRPEAHGDGDRAGHLRSRAGRRGPGRQHRGGVPADARAGPARAVRGHLQRREPGGRPARGAAGVGCCGRGGLPRRGREVPVRALLGRNRRRKAGDGAAPRSRRQTSRSASTASKPIPTSAAAPCTGRDGVVSATFALPNTTEEGPRRRFLVRPQDYREAEARASALGAELLGFYHSHPDHPARPSQYDLDHAWPFFSYIIVSVQRRRPRSHDVVAPAGGSVRVRRGRPDTCLTRFTFRLRSARSPTSRRPCRSSGATVGELLTDLTTRHSRPAQAPVHGRGRLRNFVNVYLNDEDIRYLQKEQTPVKPGDTLSIVPSVAGGAPTSAEASVGKPAVAPRRNCQLKR